MEPDDLTFCSCWGDRMSSQFEQSLVLLVYNMQISWSEAQVFCGSQETSGFLLTLYKDTPGHCNSCLLPPVDSYKSWPEQWWVPSPQDGEGQPLKAPQKPWLVDNHPRSLGSMSRTVIQPCFFLVPGRGFLLELNPLDAEDDASWT